MQAAVDMPHDLQAATLNTSAGFNSSEPEPETVRAYQSELNRLISFLAANGHSLALADLRHEICALSAVPRGHLKGPASRARALVAIRSCLRWLAREGLMDKDLSNGITLPKLEQPTTEADRPGRARAPARRPSKRDHRRKA